MSVLTFEGVVENGQIRLLDGALLPDRTKVYVVVLDAPPRFPCLRSPRLAEPKLAADFRMDSTEPAQPDPDSKL